MANRFDRKGALIGVTLLVVFLLGGAAVLLVKKVEIQPVVQNIATVQVDIVRPPPPPPPSTHAAK